VVEVEQVQDLDRLKLEVQVVQESLSLKNH